METFFIVHFECIVYSNQAWEKYKDKISFIPIKDVFLNDQEEEQCSICSGHLCLQEAHSIRHSKASVDGWENLNGEDWENGEEL